MLWLGYMNVPELGCQTLGRKSNQEDVNPYDHNPRHCFKSIRRTIQATSTDCLSETIECPRGNSMIGVDCSELTADEMLAVASAISERLEGKGVAIVRTTR